MSGAPQGGSRKRQWPGEKGKQGGKGGARWSQGRGQVEPRVQVAGLLSGFGWSGRVVGVSQPPKQRECQGEEKGKIRERGGEREEQRKQSEWTQGKEEATGGGGGDHGEK